MSGATTTDGALSPDSAARREWLGVLAKAPSEACEAAFAALDLNPGFAWLRSPEIGAVMVRGRMGGVGGPFNLGEMTVTRCSLRLEDGRVGHGYVAGRDRRKSEIAALCDALLQGAEAERVRVGVIAPMRALLEEARDGRAARAERTRVDFFALMRGEDE